MIPGLSSHLLSAPFAAGLFVVCAVFIVALYRSDRRRVSPLVGRILLALRLTLCASIVVLLCDMRRTWTETRPEPRPLAIVVDTSRSMGLPESATEGAEPRLERVRAQLGNEPIASWLGNFRWSLHAASDRLRPVATSDTVPRFADALRALPRPRESTDLAASLAGLDEPARSGALDTVVVFSDGHDHGAEPMADRAAVLRDFGARVVAVACGPAEIPSEVRILSVRVLRDPFEHEPATLVVRIRRTGDAPPAGRLRLTDSAGATVAERSVDISDRREGAVVHLDFVAGVPGVRDYDVQLLAGDASPVVDQRRVRAHVRPRAAQVLLLDGRPRWEWRYLRDGWRRDETIIAHEFLLTEESATQVPEGFPASAAGLSPYRVVILGDVSPRSVPRDWIESLSRSIELDGNALVLIAGEEYLPYAWLDTPLAELLPVAPATPLPAAQLGASIARPGISLALTRAGEAAALARLVPDVERNAELWELLPEHYWFSPIGGVAEGARTLATVGRTSLPRLPGAAVIGSESGGDTRAAESFLSERGAVVVEKPFGAGRVLYVGIDSTWRWRYRVGDELFERFWRRVVRWGLGEPASARDDAAWIAASRASYGARETIVIETALRARLPEPRVPIEAIVTVRGDEPESEGAAPETRSIDLRPAASHRYRAEIDATELLAVAPDPFAEAWAVRVRLRLPHLEGYDERTGAAELEFTIHPETDPEALDAWCDRAALEQLASAGGGVTIPLSSLDELPSLVDSSPVTRERTITVALWDFPEIIAAVILSLLFAEWVLRKRSVLI